VENRLDDGWESEVIGLGVLLRWLLNVRHDHLGRRVMIRWMDGWDGIGRKWRLRGIC
jgi:hypothetical protein